VVHAGIEPPPKRVNNLLTATRFNVPCALANGSDMLRTNATQLHG
jgi:hypothetical protein